MIRFKTKRAYVLMALMVMSVGALLIESCRSDGSDLNLSQKESEEYLGTVGELIPGAMRHKITMVSTRSGDTISGGVWVYFDRPGDSPNTPTPDPGIGGGGGNTGGDPTMPLPQTMEELYEMAASFDTDLSLDQDGTYNDSIMISESEAHAALSDLIRVSKNYLVAKGLSMTEINEAIEESGVCEDCLIPVCLQLAGYDAQSQPLPDITTQLLNCLNPPLFAAPSWDRALHCAINTLGLDILKALSMPYDKISKQLIIRAVKLVGKRTLGVVGVVWFMYEYMDCLYQ